MIEEVIKAYKFYNTNLRARYMLFAAVIFITFVFVGAMRELGLINSAVRMIYVVIIEVLAISSDEYKFWIRNNFGYGKFIRSIKNSYERLKIVMIIRIFESLIYCFVYFTFLKLTFMVFKIQTFFSMYEIFYGVILGLFMLGIDQVISYSFKNYKNNDIVNSIVIFGGGAAIGMFFIRDGIPVAIRSSSVIIGTAIFIVIYLSVMYAVTFRNIQKRWITIE